MPAPNPNPLLNTVFCFHVGFPSSLLFFPLFLPPSGFQYYALQKLEKEQAVVQEVWKRVVDHREHERGKLRERAVRRMALQAKAGQRVHIGNVLTHMRVCMQERETQPRQNRKLVL